MLTVLTDRVSSGVIPGYETEQMVVGSLKTEMPTVGEVDTLTFQYNPEDIVLQKAANWARREAHGLSGGGVEYTGGPLPPFSIKLVFIMVRLTLIARPGQILF